MRRAARGGSPGDIAAGSPAAARCSSCARAMDAATSAPQPLACQHRVCLACCAAGPEPCCVRCLRPRRPEPADLEPCGLHALPALWCGTCDAAACRACPGHAAHALRPPDQARAVLRQESLALHQQLQRLRARRRDGLLRALDAAAALTLRLEAELAAAAPTPEPPEPPGAAGPLAATAAECERLRAQHATALLQCRLDELVRRATSPLDPERLRRALCEPGAPALPSAAGGSGAGDPLLYLSNYCTAALFSRGAAGPAPAPEPWPARPLFYFSLAVGGAAAGRVVVALRPDAAPRMARNFALLASGARGVGYAGCAVFQCWEGESVITGDVERNDGRGGRAALPEGGFVPDDSRLAAVRGAVGMRRSQKRHDQLGLVGSQFRIVLREMRGFTAIFGAVVEGLPLVDRLSRTGDSAGKPHTSIVITSCGRLD